ncbi:hypothetical protein OPHB3_2460 [Oceanobacillus picturae]|uniref:Uncharacterized protein n=1 Tax=Oceanobacillus picturae TaxID=171693 RepID=A0A0U9H720_9BACI|nr:hypothetical protein [Oceanobacillus picturae]GAQ18519.1 hypothetical protein OPHB3_2460 [Oceanobacillus picturae]
MSKPKNDPLYLLRMKHERAERTDVEELRKDTEKYLSSNKPSSNEVSILASTWAFVAENIEREEWRNYDRKDWAKLEYEHVEKSRYTRPDLIDDILTAQENGIITEEEAEAWSSNYRECEYIFCLNVFEGRRDQRYCSSDCRKRMHRAEKRFNETGTYLPTSAYCDNREDTEERSYQDHEIAFEDDWVTEELLPQESRRMFGGKRDRQLEIIREIQREKYEEKGENTFGKRRENAVYYEGTGTEYL